MPPGEKPFEFCHAPSLVNKGMRAIPRPQDSRLDPAEQQGSNCPNLRQLSAWLAQENFRSTHSIGLGLLKIAIGNNYESVSGDIDLAYLRLRTESQISHFGSDTAAVNARKQDICRFVIYAR